jgi:hypothetical protein
MGGNDVAEYWEDEAESELVQAARIVSQVLVLARDEEARRILGVDGTLEEEVDLMFLDDPVAWIASEIANGIRLQEDETQGVSLSSVVALVRLLRVLRGGQLDERELREAVQLALSEEEEDDGERR